MSQQRLWHQNAAGLASALLHMRGRSQLTQAQVAARMSTTQTAIARLESGRQNPSVQTLQSYARANGYCLEIGFIRSQAVGAKTGFILTIDDQRQPEADPARLQEA
jgi:transcriptional regulator with XRE-family HTH domain